jgi:hypothetical protein
MKRPEEVTLSREEDEALIERIERNALSAEDRRGLVKVLTFYFWLLFALREAKLSLKRVKALVFGEKPKKPQPPSSGGPEKGGMRDGGRQGHPSTFQSRISAARYLHSCALAAYSHRCPPHTRLDLSAGSVAFWLFLCV